MYGMCNYGICVEYVWNMYGICMEYVWNMCGICVGQGPLGILPLPLPWAGLGPEGYLLPTP